MSDYKKLSIGIHKEDSIRVSDAEYDFVLRSLGAGISNILKENRPIVISEVKSYPVYTLDDTNFIFYIEWDFVETVNLISATLPQFEVKKPRTFWKRLIYLFTGRLE